MQIRPLVDQVVVNCRAWQFSECHGITLSFLTLLCLVQLESCHVCIVRVFCFSISDTLGYVKEKTKCSVPTVSVRVIQRVARIEVLEKFIAKASNLWY